MKFGKAGGNTQYACSGQLNESKCIGIVGFLESPIIDFLGQIESP